MELHAKYIVKLGEGNRYTVWADANTGATMRVENDFLTQDKNSEIQNLRRQSF